jgi:hypothetical protein
MAGMEQWWSDYWKGKGKKLREKLVAMPFCPPWMSHDMLYRTHIRGLKMSSQILVQCFGVLLTVHLSTILVINQLNAQDLVL